MNKKSKSKIFLTLAPIMVLVSLIGLIASCSPKPGEALPEDSEFQEEEFDVPIEAKKWAFLLYDDAEFEGYDPLENFAEEACSNENLNVLVLQDTENSNPKIWYIDENHQKQQLKNMREVNMGDYQTLRDFLE